MKPFVLFALALTLVGCQATNSNQQTDATTEWTPVNVAQSTYVWVEDNAVHFSDQSGTIPAPNATEVVWDPTDATLLWSEYTGEEGSLMMQLNPQTGTAERGHWSRSPQTNLQLSVNGRFLALQEEDDVYVLLRNTQDDSASLPFRIAERVVSAEWSPTDAALAVTTESESLYVTIDSDGSPASTVRLSDTPLYGLTFINTSTVVGLQYNEEETQAELVTIDLRSVSEVSRELWSDQEAFDGSQYRIDVSPDQTTLVVTAASNGGMGEVTSLQLQTKEKNTIHSRARVIAWLNDRTIALAVPSTSNTEARVDVIEKDILRNTAIVALEDVSHTISSIPHTP